MVGSEFGVQGVGCGVQGMTYGVEGGVVIKADNWW